MKELLNIIQQFPEVKEVKDIRPLNSGLINKTYLVETASPETPN